MSYSKQQLWQRFQKYYTEYPQLGLALDLSRMNFPDNYFDSMEPPMRKAFDAMVDLERGGIANPDEKRMVGHYWLRNPALAPTREIRSAIESTVAGIKSFAGDVHSGNLKGVRGKFTRLLLIGIGGSALGPQFVAQALGNPATDQMKVHFFDNTDPDGIDRVLSQIGGDLGQTLCVVVSKSGGTKETRNGMLEAENAYNRSGLQFPAHAVAVTSDGSDLHKHAKAQGWLRTFPMWDWVGGRTSELSAVGLLPAALQGLNFEAMLSGAKACDELTRESSLKTNPAAQLALTWHYAGNGKGDKNLIILPYKDRLELFSKYLQQLIMESLGKQLNRDGKEVNQGISVFGNKGSTDQHAYVQQLREGRNDFFATFIEVLRDREGQSMEVEPGATSGDYLSGFYQGTRTALYENGRESVTLTIHDVSPFAVGVLIALFERTVGLYASLINVNAYHQPGVEAGKKAATDVLSLQSKVLKFLGDRKTKATAESIAQAIGAPDEVETVFKICEHLAANPDRNIVKAPGVDPFHSQYGMA
jgi:glucose-6-phosphate isomerase